jgi:hypothetical protein
VFVSVQVVGLQEVNASLERYPAGSLLFFPYRLFANLDGRAWEVWTADAGSSPTMTPPAPEDFHLPLSLGRDEEVMAVTHCPSRRSLMRTEAISAASSSLP